ncbi:hypothetical protein [Flavobacterium sp.]|uniref:hypothetical protein n=1 Tax=Flavobacterium sp. TaxID=239 RepID=UPI003752F375
MNDITIRFLIAYEFLLENKRIKNTRDFGNKLNVSNSLVTEICKKRSNAGIVPIQNLLLNFEEIDADWLLTGKGEIVKSEDINPFLEIESEIKELKEKIIFYKERADFFEGKNNNQVTIMAVQVEKIYQMLMRSKVDKLIELGEKEIADTEIKIETNKKTNKSKP